MPDITPPEFLAIPPDLTLTLEEFLANPLGGSVSVTDNEDTNIAVTSVDEVVTQTSDREFVIYRTWTATDSSNNSTSAIQVIVVTDGITGNEPPAVLAPIVRLENEDNDVIFAANGSRVRTGSLTIDLLAGAVDANGDPLRIINPSPDPNADPGVTLNPDGTLTIATAIYDGLDAGKTKTLNYSYTITDDQGGTVAQTAAVTIAGRPDVYWHSDPLQGGNGATYNWQLGIPPTGTAADVADVGGAELTEQSIGTPLLVTDDRRLAGVGEFNQDGYSDLVWQQTTTGTVEIWLMQDSERLSVTTLPVTPGPTWQLAAIGDLDGDNDDDLVWRHHDSGENAVWLLNNGQLDAAFYFETLDDRRWEIVGVGDFNGDGTENEILWRNQNDPYGAVLPPSGQNAVWSLSVADYAAASTNPSPANPVMSTGTFLTAVPIPWEVVGAADVDGDRNSDIVWRDPSSGLLAIWFMAGTTVTANPILPTSLAGAWAGAV